MNSAGPPRSPGRPAAPPRRWFGLVARHAVVASVTLALVLAGAWWLAPRLALLRPLPSLEESRRRVAAAQLERYGDRARHGRFLPPAALTIAIHETFLQRSFAASLPFEWTFDDEKILARLDSIAVDVADGATIITLRGRARAAANPEMYADLLLQGTLDIDHIDFDRGWILPRIEFTDARVVDSGPPGLTEWTNPVVAYVTHRSAADWNEFQPALPLPLQFSTRVELPAVEGDFALPAVAFPVHLRLQAITALERRLAISLEVETDSSRGGPDAAPGIPWDASPGFAAGTDPRAPGGRHARTPSEATILELRRRVLGLSRVDSLWAAIRAAEHDVVVIVPEPLLARLVRATTAGYAEGVGVTLESDAVEHVEEPIRSKILGRRVTVGEVRARIQVRSLEGVIIAAGEPAIRLVPPDGLVVEMPVRLEGGAGRARFDVEWDPKAMTWLVCKGFQAQLELDGVLGRIEHRVVGTLRFAVENGRIVGRPALRRDRVRLALDFTPRSWGRVRGVFEEQDRLLRCGMVMDPDRMVAALHRLGRDGVSVRLPGGLPGFELPLTIGDSVIDSTFLVGADVRGVEVRMGAAALMVGIDGRVAFKNLP